MLTPDSVCVPPATISAPVPSITPSNVVEPLVTVSVLSPRAMSPPPASVMKDAPPVVAEMSIVPSAATDEDAAMLPAPLSFSVVPSITSVVPA